MDDPSSSSLISLIKNSINESALAKDSSGSASEQIELINNLEKYFKTTACEVMVPRPQMATVDKTQTLAEATEIIRQVRHSKLPVRDEKQDNIIGVLHTIDLFDHFNDYSDKPVSELMRRPLFASYSQPISQLLAVMKQKQTHLAIVVDEHGGVDGLITLADILEELVGDIPDEIHGLTQDYEQIEDGLVVMEANYDLDKFNKLYQTEFDKEGIETIGGYICHVQGKIPDVGETFVVGPIRFTVEERDERRLLKLRLTTPNPSILS